VIPDYVVSFSKQRTLHVGFHVSNGITRVGCFGTIWSSSLEKWDYRYRGTGVHRLCRRAACQAGFAEGDTVTLAIIVVLMAIIAALLIASPNQRRNQ